MDIGSRSRVYGESVSQIYITSTLGTSEHLVGLVDKGRVKDGRYGWYG